MVLLLSLSLRLLQSMLHLLICTSELINEMGTSGAACLFLRPFEPFKLEE